MFRRARLTLSASAIPFLLAVTAASAQGVPAAATHSTDTSVSEVVVTGSSIRGAAPVGSNLVTVGREQIEDIAPQTVQEVLKTVPAIVGMQSAGQGAYGSFDGAGADAPTIHGLGASASNSTLVLIDGHRLPLTGVNHTLADPGIIAPMAVERVEVLADGASSVYGSDAVAGVVNFITRKRYDGVDLNIQGGLGRNYNTFDVGFLGGKTWDTGSILLSYNYSDRSNLKASDRSFTQANATSLGGTNFAGFACAPATITTGGLVYYSPYAAGSGVANSASLNGRCDLSPYFDLLPSEKVNDGLVTLRQDFGDRLSTTLTGIYSNRDDIQHVARGTASATIFGPGSANPAQVNPFFTLPAGVAATSETVNFDADPLFGPGAYIEGASRTLYLHGDATYKLTPAWELNFGFVAGEDDSRLFQSGQLNSSAYDLAVNGTTNGGGNPLAPSIPGSTTVVLNTPLTTANAFDPYNVTGNRSSATTLANLIDNNVTYLSHQTLANFYGKIDGSLFNLPAGAVKLAIGGEYNKYTLHQDITRANNTGAASTGSSSLALNYNRDVESAYGELLVPLVSPEMNIPAVHRLDLNISGRYDRYSDFGGTTNPKFAANWEPFAGIKIRGNYARSFTAPALTSRGSNAVGLTGESAFSGVNGGTVPGGAFTVSTASFPGAIGLPGCPPGSATCAIGSGVTGILLAGGNAALKPQTGSAYSVGVDITPQFAPGLRLSGTYWTNNLRGGITAPVPALALGSADLSYLLQLYPNGATPAQIAAATGGLPQTAALPATTYFIYDYRQRNVLNLNVAGFDLSADYRRPTDFGVVTVGASATIKTKFDQFFGANGKVFSVLGTAGFNTTFPSVKYEARGQLGLEHGPFVGIVYVNYLGGYLNYGGSSQIPVVRTNGVPTGGGAPVADYTTVDLHVAYKLKSLPFTHEVALFVDVTNLFDKDPPFYNNFTLNGASGYDAINANPIGRLVTVGLRSKF